MSIAPLTFDLHYRKQARSFVGGRWTKTEDDEAREAQLPDRPVGFVPMRGDHPHVHAEAKRLNDAQERSRFTRYFFYPEVAPTTKAR